MQVSHALAVSTIKRISDVWPEFAEVLVGGSLNLANCGNYNLPMLRGKVLNQHIGVRVVVLVYVLDDDSVFNIRAESVWNETSSKPWKVTMSSNIVQEIKNIPDLAHPILDELFGMLYIPSEAANEK